MIHNKIVIPNKNSCTNSSLFSLLRKVTESGSSDNLGKSICKFTREKLELQPSYPEIRLFFQMKHQLVCKESVNQHVEPSMKMSFSFLFLIERKIHVVKPHG